MRTAIDSSVLLAIFNAEADAISWLELLMEARRQGRLLICDVVYAEIAPAFASQADLDEALRKLGVALEAVGPAAAWRAGITFRQYRVEGGPRTRMIPDFLIAAHARLQADQIAAKDRGYLRRYFSDLRCLHP
jgi:hypothetical protein